MEAESFSDKHHLVNSIIGEGTRFRGDLEIQGLLRIDGDFEGNIRTDGRVLIGQNGRALCNTQADIVVVGGVVKGDIQVKNKVVLLSTSVVLGTIRAPRIVVEEGSVLHGHCTVSTNTEGSSSNSKNGSFSLDWNSTGSSSSGG